MTSSSIPAQSESVLIVENEKIHLDVLVSMLQDDYRLLIAKTGEQAIRSISGGESPGLILLDIQMPGMGGHETCKRLKADIRFSDIPIIFLTAKDEPEDEAFGLGLGAVDYIVKPISPATVKARIQTHLQLRRVRHSLQTQNEELERRVHERTARLRSLTSEMSLAEERERRRIAVELHDGPAQRLALAKMKLGKLRALSDAPQRNTLDEVIEAIDVTVRETRTLIVQLSPPVLYELGLAPAIEWFTDDFGQQNGLECHVVADGDYQNLDQDLKVFLFQAVRELLINIVKHARADSATISLEERADKVVIQVTDNGVGFDQAGSGMRTIESGGFGLFSLRERLDLYRGTLRIVSDQGSRVTIEVPKV